jgi:cathepsin L
MHHNEQYDANQTFSFNCSINKFTDLTPEEFKSRMTGFDAHLEYDFEKPIQTEIFPFKKRKKVPKLPKFVDWRENAVTNVKIQGDCASCYAFAAAGSLEGQIFLKTRQLFNISVQHFIDCVLTEVSMGCIGGIMSDVYQFAMEHGVVKDELYPYEEIEGYFGCMEMEKIPVKITGFKELPIGDELELQRAVATTGPVSVAIDASWQSMQFYEFGLYFEELCTTTNLNHAVLVVGYGTDEELGDYWIVKNSWGER